MKAGGVDLVPGLGESMRMECSGDVNLNNGSLQELIFIDLISSNVLGWMKESHSLQDLTIHQDLADDLCLVGKCK